MSVTSVPIIGVVAIAAIVVFVWWAKKEAKRVQEEKACRKKEEEERRIAQEKYKQDIQSEKISYWDEIARISAAMEEYRQNTLEMVNLWKQHHAAEKAGNPDNSLLREMRRREPKDIGGLLQEAKELNDIKRTALLESLIEDGEKMKQAFDRFWSNRNPTPGGFSSIRDYVMRYS